MSLSFPPNPVPGQVVSTSFTQNIAGEDRTVTRTWIWSDTTRSWVANREAQSILDIPQFVGPQGPIGPRGLQGASGPPGTPGSGGETINIALIDSSEKVSGVAKWNYQVRNSTFNGSWSPSGSSYTANNLLEYGNSGTTAYGFSVSTPDGITLQNSNFSGFSIKPVPNGIPVVVFERNGSYFFSAPNPIDGDCI